MKRFITYLFLCAFLLHTASRVVVCVNFWLNQDFIAENLCENREQPQMECNGMCHLKKELTKDDERKQKDNQQQVEFILFIPSESCFELTYSRVVVCEKQQHCASELSQKPIGYSTAIFHPPIS